MPIGHLLGLWRDDCIVNHTDRRTNQLSEADAAALGDLAASMFPQRRRRFGVTGGVGFWEMSGDRSREMWGRTHGPMEGVADVRPPIVPRGPRRGKQSSGLDGYTLRAIKAHRRGDEGALVAARVIGPLGRMGELGDGDDFVGAITPPRPRPLGPGGSQVPPKLSPGRGSVVRQVAPRRRGLTPSESLQVKQIARCRRFGA